MAGSARYRSVAAAAVLVQAMVLTACGSAARAPESIYYVSIGDSYAAGDGPRGPQTRDGYAYLTETALRRDNSSWRLINFGCSGATAQQMAFEAGCDDGARAPGGPQYRDRSQLEAATRFIADHHDQVGLVTVVAGGDDVAPCVSEVAAGTARECAEAATGAATAALDEMLTELRGVLDPAVPVVGVSYVNVFVAGQQPALASMIFDEHFNPALQQAYSRHGARFVGPISGSVEEVCALSYYCSDEDPHPNRAGHQYIADRVVDAAGFA